MLPIQPTTRLAARRITVLLRALGLALPLVLAATAVPAQVPQGAPQPGPVLDGKTAAAAPARPGAPRVIRWDDLVPADWDPMKEFKGMDFNILSDADPRAQQLLKKMREVWDAAPVNQAMAGRSIRIPGYVVPLEETKDGLKEFLLVPYFGACIHTPPPPANQIIHVLPKTPARGVKSMDAVWISGILATVRTDSYMGAASYRVEALAVEPYRERPR
jgi:hypothetical protein